MYWTLCPCHCTVGKLDQDALCHGNLEEGRLTLESWRRWPLELRPETRDQCGQCGWHLRLGKNGQDDEAEEGLLRVLFKLFGKKFLLQETRQVRQYSNCYLYH
jgi:hypothetical protein